MTTTQRIALAVVSAVMVGAGVWLLREGAPEPQAAAPQAPLPTGPTAIAAPTPALPGSAPAADAVDGSVAPKEPAPPASGPTVEVAPSPFADATSEELQYAVKLVTGPGTGPAEWRKAAEVFQRCVDVNPTNHLCKRGVYAAWERIDSDGGPPTALSKPVTFQPGERLEAVDEVLRNQNLKAVGR